MPTRRLGQFRQNIGRATDLVALGQALGTLTVGRVDASDLYRAALVQAVAALDEYVHGVVLDRAVDILLGRRPGNAAGSKVGLHFHAVQELLTAGAPAQVELSARTHIAQRLALETFQRPDSIASAFAMVGLPRLWSTAFPADPGGTKKALGLIVDRRNRIVHSCDADALAPGTVLALSSTDAADSIATVDRIVSAIDQIC
jgi:hypothetical protein